VLRVGGASPRQVDVRVVAATNRALRDEVAAGRFREDLFFRLNVIPLSVPPLRERRDDVLPLARHFLQRHASEAGRPLRFSADAERTLVEHEWRGNVRELENAVERAAVLTRADVIEAEDLLLEEFPVSRTAATDGSLQESLDRAASARIQAALDEAGGNRTEAARSLGIDRTTLYRLMRRIGM